MDNLSCPFCFEFREGRPSSSYFQTILECLLGLASCPAIPNMSHQKIVRSCPPLPVLSTEWTLALEATKTHPSPFLTPRITQEELNKIDCPGWPPAVCVKQSFIIARYAEVAVLQLILSTSRTACHHTPVWFANRTPSPTPPFPPRYKIKHIIAGLKLVLIVLSSSCGCVRAHTSETSADRTKKTHRTPESHPPMGTTNERLLSKNQDKTVLLYVAKNQQRAPTNEPH